MRTQVPDSDGSVAAAFGVTLAMMVAVLALVAPVPAAIVVGGAAAGYLLAGARSTPRTGTRRRRQPS